MKIQSIISGLFILFLLGSCQKEAEKPKVIYDSTVKKTTAAIRDTAKIVIADLPVQMQGTEYLIHPVGDLRINERRAKTGYGSITINEESFTISNVAQYEITGYLQNLKFQKINSDSIRPLTTKPILIETATYLKTVADRINKQILVYTMVDADTNKDGKLDTNDINTLYLSTIDGNDFTKVSIALEELLDWNIIESTNRLYFRTIEDTNKNGQFDQKDLMHYNYIDLYKNEWKAVRYAPL